MRKCFCALVVVMVVLLTSLLSGCVSNRTVKGDDEVGNLKPTVNEEVSVMPKKPKSVKLTKTGEVFVALNKLRDPDRYPRVKDDIFLRIIEEYNCINNKIGILFHGSEDFYDWSMLKTDGPGYGEYVCGFNSHNAYCDEMADIVLKEVDIFPRNNAVVELMHHVASTFQTEEKRYRMEEYMRRQHDIDMENFLIAVGRGVSVFRYVDVLNILHIVIGDDIMGRCSTDSSCEICDKGAAQALEIIKRVEREERALASGGRSDCDYSVCNQKLFAEKRVCFYDNEVDGGKQAILDDLIASGCLRE